uniref:TonB family protein n=1 Tax=Solibacter usitatus (strain Ellin6076) TaxID=234267 RepID=Q02A96_SOLUE
MSTHLIWDNLVAYSMQIGLLIGLAAFVPALLRLKVPHTKLAYWQILLATCLLLPAVRPWKQAMLTVSRPVFSNIADLPPMQPMPPTSLSTSEIALAILGAGIVLRLCWFAVAFLRLGRLRHHSQPLTPPTAWSVEADIRVSEAISSPVTFGFLRPVVLLPANFSELDVQIQDAILCHEVLHVRRRDWLFTLGEELVRSLFWFHPAIWWLLGEIGLAREQEVDRLVVELTKSREGYVDALLAIAGAAPRLDLAPAPLFLRKRHLKQRVVSIMKEVRMSKTRSFSALAAGLGFLAAACWLVTATFPLAAAPQSVNDFPGVTVDTGGPVMHRTAVIYPDAARLHNIQGVVVVEASLDSSGNVTDTRVLSGPPELRRAAQQAVLQWHFSMEGSSNTRQVKINFELPSGQRAPATVVTVNPPAMGAVNDPEKIAAAEAKIRALRSQITDQTAALRSSQDEAARQQAAAKLSELQENVSNLQRNLGPASLAGKRLARINVMGLSDQVRDQLLSRLPVHTGDTLSADSYDLTSKAVREFDEHMFVSQSANSQTGEVAFTIVQGGGSIASVSMTAPTTPATPGVKRITIGGNVQQTKLVSQARPVYPPLAKQARISGVVHLQAVIAKDGNVMDLKVISGHPLLIPAALEAVKTWVYQTTLLNGEPVEVVTQIDVNFTLSEEGGN